MSGRISSIIRNRRTPAAEQPNRAFRLVDLQHGYRRMGRSPRRVLRALREQSGERELHTRLKAATRTRIAKRTGVTS